MAEDWLGPQCDLCNSEMAEVQPPRSMLWYCDHCVRYRYIGKCMQSTDIVIVPPGRSGMTDEIRSGVAIDAT